MYVYTDYALKIYKVNSSILETLSSSLMSTNIKFIFCLNF